MTSRLTRAVLALITPVLVTACSPTSYDSSAEPTHAPTTTSTSLPTGSIDDLLPRMLAEVGALSQRVSNADGDGAAATRIEQLWTAMKPEVSRRYPHLVTDFEFVVRRCNDAAKYNRPSDADRAYKNLQELVSALLPEEGASARS